MVTCLVPGITCHGDRSPAGNLIACSGGGSPIPYLGDGTQDLACGAGGGSNGQGGFPRVTADTGGLSTLILVGTLGTLDTDPTRGVGTGRALRCGEEGEWLVKGQRSLLLS